MWVWWLTPQMVVSRWWQYFLNGYVKYGTMQVCDGPNGGGSKMGLWNWIVRYRGVEGFLWEYTMFPPPTMAIFGLIKLEVDLWTSSLVSRSLNDCLVVFGWRRNGNGASYTLLDYMEGNLIRFLILIPLHPWSWKAIIMNKHTTTTTKTSDLNWNHMTMAGIKLEIKIFAHNLICVVSNLLGYVVLLQSSE